MQAERKLASVPASSARNPSRARSCRRSGARAPIPPSWMPIELKLANPQRANVAIVNDRSSSCAFGARRARRRRSARSAPSACRAARRRPRQSSQGTPSR